MVINREEGELSREIEERFRKGERREGPGGLMKGRQRKVKWEKKRRVLLSRAR